MAYPERVPTLTREEFEQITAEMDEFEPPEGQRERIEKHLEILQESEG